LPVSLRPVADQTWGSRHAPKQSDEAIDYDKMQPSMGFWISDTVGAKHSQK